MASNYDGNKGVNGNGLLYFIGKVKTWIDTYFLKKNLGSSKASKVVVTDSSGNVDVSTITSTELGYLSGMGQNITTALGYKANQTDLTDLGNSFGTFSNTTVPNTYQEKMTIGGGTAGAVTTISAGDNVIITTASDSDTATISASIPQATTSQAGVMSPTMVTTLNNAAPVASPALTGTPTAPTAATSTNTTQIATTAFVHAAIENADIGGKTYQGNIDAENSATGKRALKDIKTFKQGQYFTVSSAFTFADGSWALGIGDMLFVKENYTWASGNVDGSKFAAVQGNNDYLTNSELDAIFTEVFGSAA